LRFGAKKSDSVSSFGAFIARRRRIARIASLRLSESTGNSGGRSSRRLRKSLVSKKGVRAMSNRSNMFANHVSYRGIAIKAMAVCFFATGPANAADDRAIDPKFSFAMQRDLGVMPGQLKQYLQDQDAAAERSVAASEAMGDSFAGSWLEQLPGGRAKLVVATTKSPALAARSVTGMDMREVEFRQVKHSLGALRAEADKLNAYSTYRVLRPIRNILSWGMDERSNSVVIETTPDGVDEAIDFAAGSGIDSAAVRIVTKRYRYKTEATAILGGSRYIMNNGFACSIGFSARRNNPGGGFTDYFLTAGHCAGNGVIASGSNGKRIGIVFGSSYPFNDYAVVRVDRPQDWSVSPYVRDNSGDGRLSIKGSSAQVVGGAICRSGFNSGFRCGKITSKNRTINYGSTSNPEIVYGLGLTDACSGPGDSGGSYVALISNNWQAQGVHSGGGGTPPGKDNSCSVSADDRVTIYQPVGEILSANNVYLIRD
jgi:alpha-lytic endopeptidase